LPARRGRRIRTASHQPTEKAVLAHALKHPTHGAQRVADELMLRGLQVSSGGVRGVWIRNKLQTRHHRLLRLEETVRKRKIKLTEEQIRALERFDPEFRERHIEVPATGELVAVDTFFAGTLKGVGKVYIQTVLDCFSRHVWVRLYTSKMPVTAVQILNNHVLPFFEKQGVKIRTILSDNGHEYCGRPDKHPYELFLQLEDIEHRTTKVGRPQSNGFIERFHRTLLEEHLRIKGADDLVRDRRGDAEGPGRVS
jgi:transposase InsO family protein